MTILFPGVQESTVPSTTIKNSALKASVDRSTPQSVATTGITYLVGSALPVPNGGLNLGAAFKFDVGVTKTGAGTAIGTISVLAGPKGDVTDTVIASFTKPAGTANAASAKISVGGEIASHFATTQVPYVIPSHLEILNSLSTQGVISLPVDVIDTLVTLSTTQVAALTAAQFVGLALTLGASDNYTVDYVNAELGGLTTGAPNA